MTTVLRTAVLADAEAIARFHVACWRESFAGLVPQDRLDELDTLDRVGMWRDRLTAPGDTTVLALDDGHVVGHAQHGPLDEPGLPATELRSLYVARSHHGAGLGRRLVEAALRGGPATLWVFEGNHRARGFYRATGWLPTGERVVEPWTGLPQLRLLHLGAEGDDARR